MEIVEALGSFTDKESHAVLLLSLQKDPAPEVRARSAWVLGEIRAHDAVDALLKALEDSSVLVGLNSAQALGKIKDKRAVPGLSKVLNKDILGLEAVSALGEIGDVSAVESLKAVYGTKDELYNARVETALKKLGR